MDKDKIIEQLIKEKGGTREQYLNLLNKIAYHESAGTLDPTIKQFGGGPGRGKYQFEEGKNSGGITAARRTKQYLEKIGKPVPKWLDKVTSGDSLDATQLDSDQQDILFLGNMRMHPKADFSKVWKGQETEADFWANYHWAGDDKDRNTRLKSFNDSVAEYKPLHNSEKKIADIKQDIAYEPSYDLPTREIVRDNIPKVSRVRPEEPKVDNTVASVAYNPEVDERGNFNNLISYLSNQKAMGGSLNNCGGEGQPPCDENYFQKIRNSRNNQTMPGTNSSHLMADNNKDTAYPTLFRNKDGSWEDLSNNHDAAFKRATIDNEIYTFSNKDDLVKFARKGSWKNNKLSLGGSIAGNTKDKNLNAFNTGGLHEQNPLGGIPLGMGSNGKPNTVEEDETSFELRNGKFIFSNRIKI